MVELIFIFVIALTMCGLAIYDLHKQQKECSSKEKQNKNPEIKKD